MAQFYRPFQQVLDATRRNMEIMSASESIDPNESSIPDLEHIRERVTDDVFYHNQTSLPLHIPAHARQRRAVYERHFADDWFRKTQAEPAESVLAGLISLHGPITRHNFRFSDACDFESSERTEGDFEVSSEAPCTQDTLKKSGFDFMLSRCLEFGTLQDFSHQTVWIDDDLLKAMLIQAHTLHEGRAISRPEHVCVLLAQSLNSLVETGYTTRGLSDFVAHWNGDPTSNKIQMFEDGTKWTLSYDEESKPHVVIVPSPPSNWSPLDFKVLLLDPEAAAVVQSAIVAQSLTRDCHSPLPEESGGTWGDMQLFDGMGRN